MIERDPDTISDREARTIMLRLRLGSGPKYPSDLEVRECACGCEKRFAVHKGSKQRYALAYHDPNHKVPRLGVDWKDEMETAQDLDFDTPEVDTETAPPVRASDFDPTGITVEKNVPIPERSNTKTSPLREFLSKREVNESFVVPTEIAKKVSAMGKSLKMKFAVRKVDEEKSRVWRIA